MIALILLLAAEPKTAIPVPSPPGSRLIDPTPQSCRDLAVRTQGPTSTGPLGVSRPGDVSHYLLLDRWIDGCPAPIVVNRRVPGSDAVIRQPGLTPGSTQAPRAPQP
jgi:hypothetical protein